MTISERVLIDAIESTLFLLPAVPGLAQDLGVPGIRGRVTKLDSVLANLCGDARLGDREVDAVIARVRERYGSLRFGWVTGPSTRPLDLQSRLAAAGLKRAGSLSGMARTDLATPIAASASVRIREVSPQDAVAASDMMGRAYGIPSDVARFFNEMLAASTGIKTRSYFAYLDGEAPVAWSYLVYIPDSPLVLLGGAATLAEQRGHGVYTALVARRLADARADGRTAAIIQADRDTSAPICAKLGFRELCGLEIFAAGPH